MAWSFFTKEGVEKIGEFGVVGLTGGDADTLDGLDSTMYWKKSETIQADELEGYGASDFILKTGGAMTGALLLNVPPVPAGNEAVDADYVNAADALKLNLAGGTLTGPLNLPVADPTAPTHAAHKSYVDFQIGATVAVAGDTMTGPLILSANPVAPLGAATKQYVDAGLNATVAVAGDTMTGPLVLAADPAVPLGAATRQYVDAAEQDAKDYTDAQILGVTSGTSGVPIVLKTADYTTTVTDQVILVDVTAGPVVIELAGLAGNGKLFTIKHVAGNITTNPITVMDESGGFIEGLADYTLDTDKEWVTVIRYNYNWQVIS